MPSFMLKKLLQRRKLERLASLFKKDRIGVCKDGHLNNLDLRYSNEAARHKLLDVIGDLMLVGLPIKGKIIAHKPGHGSNTTFAKIMKEVIKKTKKSTPCLQSKRNSSNGYSSNHGYAPSQTAISIG